MTSEELNKILALAEAKEEQAGWKLPSGCTLTFHLASAGVGLSVSRVESLKVEGTQLQAKTSRHELFVVSLNDVFACSVDSSSQHKPKAGFVS